MKSRYQTACTNCKEPMPKQFVFQGVVICERCHKIVSHLVQRARKEIEMLFLTYTDMLRVALVKGEMNFPVLPKSKRMPGNDMQRAIYEMAVKMGAAHEAERSETDGAGEVSPLQGDPASRDGEVQPGGCPATVPGRGDVRPVPEMQEDGACGSRSPQGRTDPADRLGGDPQGVNNG